MCRRAKSQRRQSSNASTTPLPGRSTSSTTWSCTNLCGRRSPMTSRSLAILGLVVDCEESAVNYDIYMVVSKPWSLSGFIGSDATFLREAAGEAEANITHLHKALSNLDSRLAQLAYASNNAHLNTYIQSEVDESIPTFLAAAEKIRPDACLEAASKLQEKLFQNPAIKFCHGKDLTIYFTMKPSRNIEDKVKFRCVAGSEGRYLGMRDPTQKDGYLPLK
ncbi:unnamed protein product, partial [Symbiodinium pilosum]